MAGLQGRGARGLRPSGFPLLNYGSLQAQRLLMCATMSPSGGLVDIVAPSKRFTANGTMPPRGVSRWVTGPDINGTNYFVTVEAPPDAPYITSAGVTLSWWGIVDDLGIYNHFAGKHTGNGGNSNPFDFRANNSGLVDLVRANAVGFSIHTASISLTVGVLHHVLCSVANDLIETAPLWLIDGVIASDSAFQSAIGAVTGDGSPIRIGRRADGAVQLDGVTAEFRAYGYGMSLAQAWTLYENPFDLYWVPSTRAYQFFGAALTVDAGMSSFRTRESSQRANLRRRCGFRPFDPLSFQEHL